MIYTYPCFLELEYMTDNELKKEIHNATTKYLEVHSLYIREGEDANVEHVALSIIFNNLKNVEAYIRKAENLLHNYDDDKITQRYISNRENFLNNKRINNIRNNIVRKKVK